MEGVFNLSTNTHENEKFPHHNKINSLTHKTNATNNVSTLDSPVCFSLSACFVTLCKKSICLMVRSRSASMLHC